MIAMNTTRLLVAAIGLALLAPQAVAQAMDHSAMSMPMPQASTAKKQPAKKKAPAKPKAKSPDAMDHSQMQGMDHSGMDHSGMEGMDHSMHQQAPAPDQPTTPIPAITDADRAAAVPPHGGHDMMDNAIHGYALLNRLETWNDTPGRGVAWEGRGWIGTDLNRVWLRTEGERVSNHTESASAEVLYGHSVSPWWDVVAGVRHDFRPGDGQTFAAIGVQGLAPQKFEVEATAYLGQRGQVALRFETEYELLLTNRLILQPMVEVNAYGKDDRLRGISSGLSTAGAGLRLRYEFTRQFAPYIGVTREQAFGRTADFRREASGQRGDTRFVLGFRTWF
ncbi:MAG: copper resistance protein B [Proteobacteria bacterium]|nr:copper resistance protein B [Pseudomonadota bacterium]MBS0218766.1 copper resistance protein B [Pseudomonadota bacterium]